MVWVSRRCPQWRLPRTCPLIRSSFQLSTELDGRNADIKVACRTLCLRAVRACRMAVGARRGLGRSSEHTLDSARHVHTPSASGGA